MSMHIKSEQFLKLPAVIDRTGKPRSTIYAEMKSGKFPKPIKTGTRSVAWTSSSIAIWQQACINAPKTVGAA